MVNWNLKDILTKVPNLHVVETDGWLTRTTSGTFAPVGVMAHHTATPIGSNTSSNLNVVIKGRSDVPGPLCNIFISRQGVVYLVSNLKANDSGRGNSSVLDKVRQGIEVSGNATSSGLTNGNPYFFDIEVDNNGVGEPYPDVQIDTLIKVCAAICNHFKWNKNHVIHHREWTSRKIDMSWRGALRDAVGLTQLALVGFNPQPPQSDTVISKGVVRVENIGTAQVKLQHKGFGLCEGAVDVNAILGHPPTAIIGVVPQGPYPSTDGWWLETADVCVRAQFRGNYIWLTAAGYTGASDGFMCFVAFA